MIEIFQNIREIYDFTCPCGELLPYVEFFSESSAEKCGLHFDKGHASVTMFESWTPTFYLNLTGPYVIDIGAHRYQIAGQQDILILRNGAVTRYNGPGDRIFTLKFYPGGMEAVLGVSQLLLRDMTTDIGQLFPMALREKMKQAPSFTERVRLLEAYLLGKLRQADRKEHYLRIVREAIGEYTASGMQLNTGQVAERCFVTSKSINRYFHRAIGVSPKSYFSVLRARTALTAMVSDRAGFSPEQYGYYDGGHFYKDVASFTGKPLRRLQGD